MACLIRARKQTQQKGEQLEQEPDSPSLDAMIVRMREMNIDSLTSWHATPGKSDLPHSHSSTHFSTRTSAGGIGITVTSACLNARSPIRMILRRDLQCGSGHATSASVVIQSCGCVTCCLAARSGRTAPKLSRDR